MGSELITLEVDNPFRPGLSFTACASCPKDPNGCCSAHHPAFTLWDLCVINRGDSAFVELILNTWQPGLFEGGPAVLVKGPSPQCPLLGTQGCTLARPHRPSHCNLFVCHGQQVPPLLSLVGAMRDYTRRFGQQMASRWALATGDLRPGQAWSRERLRAVVAWATPQLEAYVAKHPLPTVSGPTQLEVARQAWFRDHPRL